MSDSLGRGDERPWKWYCYVAGLATAAGKFVCMVLRATSEVYKMMGGKWLTKTDCVLFFFLYKRIAIQDPLAYPPFVETISEAISHQVGK